MYKSKNINYISIIALCIIFILILFLNMKTPYVADDFNNMFRGDERVTNIFQVIQNQIYRYYSTNGRFLAHTIGGIIMIFNKNFINVINSVGFCILMYQISMFTYLGDLYASSRDKRYKKIIKECKYGEFIYQALFLIMVFLFVWKFTPVFGQDFLWVIGAANYMWTNIILIASLLVARRIFDNRKEIVGFGKILGVILLSLLAGATNENSVPAAILILIYYCMHMYLNEKKDISLIIFILVSMVAGFVVMISAPGNFKRMAMFDYESSDMLVRYMVRMNKVGGNFTEYFLILLAISIFVLLIARMIDFRKNFESEFFILAAILSNYSMIMAPTAPLRVLDITVIFFVISIVLNISIIGRFNIYIALGILCAAVIYGGATFVSTYPKALADSGVYASKYSAREIIIKDAKNMGKLENIELPPVTSDNPYTAAYNLGDCETDKNYWVNIAIARYYGVLSVVLRNK